MAQSTQAARAGGDTVVDLTEQAERELTDEELAAEAAREGSDGPAFVALVGRFRERIWRICFRLMGHADDAQDAAQEVFVRLFQSRAKFDGRSKYSTWVHGVAVRTCLTLRRGRGRRLRHERTAGEASTVTLAEASHTARPELALDLEAALDTLDELDRALVVLKYGENYSYDELAEMFGLSTSACKMRVSRARERIQREFGETM
jgi:RNA polymerase sigma-70 factor (ECF subfamily)